MSADPSATPRVDVEEGPSQTSMDISPSTETSRLEEVVSLTGSYQRIRWGSKVGMKDEPGVPYIEIIPRKLFCTPFRKDWGHGGERGLEHEEWGETKGLR